jgi:hypothetical protein
VVEETPEPPFDTCAGSWEFHALLVDISNHR